MNRKHFLKGLASLGIGGFAISRLTAKEPTRTQGLTSPLPIKRDARTRAFREDVK